jgi:AbrB family looped-hinge helix DNA binding protein
MRTTVSAKGRITIPAELRAELGLVPGTSVVFERTPGGALFRKAQSEHPVDRVFGILRQGSRVAAMIELRGGSGLGAKAGRSNR